MKKMKKAVVLSLISAMMLSAFAGCGKKSDSDVLRIGGTGPLTGGVAVYGMAAKRGAEIAVHKLRSGPLPKEFAHLFDLLGFVKVLGGVRQRGCHKDILNVS